MVSWAREDSSRFVHKAKINMSHVIAPKQIRYSELLKNHSSLSPHSLKGVSIPNKNVKTLRDLLGDNFTKGRPISRAYFVENSDKYLITNSALQDDFTLSKKRGSAFISISPNVFSGPVLLKESILLAMNGNVGQSSYVDIDDVENYTISPWMTNFNLGLETKYIFGFLKSKFFLDQVEFLTPKGAILSNANEKILDAQIVFPNGKNSADVIRYVQALVESVIFKEKEIQRKNTLIFSLIEDEIVENQKKATFQYRQPKVSDLLNFNRINAAFYSEDFKKEEFKILNYTHGVSSISDLGFDITRGQNLQVSCIGKSIYSDEKNDGFYTLIIPKNISTYGTVLKYEYLGSAKKLKTLKKGDIIFGAEGFEKGRSVVVFEDKDKTITNIHGMTLNHTGKDIGISVFVKCFLDYLRQTGLIDLYAVGGNGGSLAQKYWEVIPFPNFPKTKQEEIANLYFKGVDYKLPKTTDEFLNITKEWDRDSGIFQIDESLKKTKEHLELVIDQIVKDEKIEIDFSFI
jgi:type I restriction enzyme S subunit